MLMSKSSSVSKAIGPSCLLCCNRSLLIHLVGSEAVSWMLGLTVDSDQIPTLQGVSSPHPLLTTFQLGEAQGWVGGMGPPNCTGGESELENSLLTGPVTPFGIRQEAWVTPLSLSFSFAKLA